MEAPSESDLKKYFGLDARSNFFDKGKWVNNQLKITSTNKTESTSRLYFNTPEHVDARTAIEEAKSGNYDTGAMMLDQYFPGSSDSPSNTNDAPVDMDSVVNVYDATSDATTGTFSNFDRSRNVKVFQPMSSNGVNDRTTTAMLGRRTGTDRNLTRTLSSLNNTISNAKLNSDANNCLSPVHLSPSMPVLTPIISTSKSLELPRPNNLVMNEFADAVISPSVSVSPAQKILARRKKKPMLSILSRQSSCPNSEQSLPSLKPMDPILSQSKGDILDILAIEHSPRTSYITECAKTNVLAKPSLLIRKQVDGNLILEHKGTVRWTDNMLGLSYVLSLFCHLCVCDLGVVNCDTRFIVC